MLGDYKVGVLAEVQERRYFRDGVKSLFLVNFLNNVATDAACKTSRLFDLAGGEVVRQIS